MDDDDVFDQSEEAEKDFALKSYDRYTEQFLKDGYREGLSGTGATLQESFDDGYTSAFRVSKEFGTIRSVIKFTLGLADEGRLSVTDDQAEKLQCLDGDLTTIQTKLDEYVKKDKGLTELASKMKEKGDAKLSDLWNERLRRELDLDEFKARTNEVLQEIGCEWKV